MKRIIIITLACLVVNFVFVTTLSILLLPLPDLLEGTAVEYRIIYALLNFVEFLEPTIFTGFLIGCVIEFGLNSGGSSEPFSPTMFNRYKTVVILGIGIVFILTLSSEVLKPLCLSRKEVLEEAPKELEEYSKLADRFYTSNDFMRAAYFAKVAHDIAPTNEAIAQKYHDYTDAMQDAKLTYTPRLSSNIEMAENITGITVKNGDTSWTVARLLDMAQEEYNTENYLNAHYYARLAFLICGEQDTNYLEAKRIADEAWEKLELPNNVGNQESFDYYKKKYDAYIALCDNDYVKAYYLFMNLSNISQDNAKDPDIKRYLLEAQEKLNRDYFFTEEVSDMKHWENSSNICFKLKKGMGKTDVIFIRGMSLATGKSKKIRYARDISIYCLDSEQNLEFSFTAPYAKIVSQDAKTLSDHDKEKLGIKKNHKLVPCLLLKSVDKDVEGEGTEPTITYSRRSDIKLQDLTKYILPMPYSDMNALSDLSHGASRMSLYDLAKFMYVATDYGYSSVAFGQAFIIRITQPLVLLTLLTFVAAFAWNYRILRRQMFRFKWILAIPLFAIVLYALLECTQYACTLTDCVFFSAFGFYSIIVAFSFYTLCFLIVSVIFLSRYANKE